MAAATLAPNATGHFPPGPWDSSTFLKPLFSLSPNLFHLCHSGLCNRLESPCREGLYSALLNIPHGLAGAGTEEVFSEYVTSVCCKVSC